MTTGIEVVASVIGIAGAGFKLSLVLNAINCEIANAPYEIKAISKSLIIYSHLLKQTAAVLEKGNSIHSQEALRTTEQVIDESNAVFADINAMLDRVRTTRADGSVSPSVPQRFKWCFRKHGIEYLLGRLDRLQMSLSLMLQIIQLGTMMASTSRHDPPARVEQMTNRIQRERVEAQTIVIQFFQENESLDRLYVAAREEETEPMSPIESRHDHGDSDSLTIFSQDSQLTKVEDHSEDGVKSLVIVSPYKDILTDYGQSWTEMGKSAEAMLNQSDGLINVMLERWTRWRERRELENRQPRSNTSGRYNPMVHDFLDDEDELYGMKFQDREDSPLGKYLEGTTTNWREPHSSEARLQARRLRKAYEPYQPSVEGSSDVDHSPSSNGSRKASAKKHVIDSSSETSNSDSEQTGEVPRPRRRSSAIAVPQRSKYADDPLPTSRSYNPPSTITPSSSGNITNTRPTLSPGQTQYSAKQRPLPVPDQNQQHHSYSSPAPNAYMHGGKQYTYPPPTGNQPVNQHGPPMPYAYTPLQPAVQNRHSQTPYLPRLSSQTSRQGQPVQRPPSRDSPPRAKSRDGMPPKSPSRLSREYTPADYRTYEEERKRQKKEKRRHISDGAAKGLLAGGSLAVFLEALDALDL